ncbi:MAG TPA: hypothetical protein VHO25_21115, partial [Polyangiaceae bacterium]|nr:hypothetical protein [Polyangiaceae bacterium]
MPITASNLYAIAAVLLAAGCRCSDGASSSAAAVSSAEASASSGAAEGVAQPSCTLRAGQFSLSPTDGRTVVATDEEDLDLPFAVELGEAVRYRSGFAVTGLRAAQNGNQAVLAVLPRGLQGVRVVELGAVHGDVAPPRLAVSGDNLIAVVPEADA